MYIGTALNGRCAKLPELVQTPLPLQATLSIVPCQGGETFLRQLFEPLGYVVSVIPHMLDETHSEWGMSGYYTVTLENSLPLERIIGAYLCACAGAG